MLTIPAWKRSPAIRPLVAVIGGILIQWYTNLPAGISGFLIITTLSLAGVFFFMPFRWRLRLAVAHGAILLLLFGAIGAALVFHHDIRHHADWYGRFNAPGKKFIVTILEKPVAKPNSWKTTGCINAVADSAGLRTVTGKIILYFPKNLTPPGAGSKIVVSDTLVSIRNTGNPGHFDYARYSLFHGVTHQLFIDSNEFQLLPGYHGNWLDGFLIRTRDWVICILQECIPGHSESGLAEALLIGYKHDLDPDLVRSYSNTGVVHIIAISGLHLGIIYLLLLRIFSPLSRIRSLAWMPPILIVVALWVFTLLAGAQPSVLRSAVMFTCIVISGVITRQASLLNTLAVSAFLLICYDPFCIWDAGFQLSYAAVGSIGMFNRAVYGWFDFHNRIVDEIWKLLAVTIAAQLMTIPLCLYLFKQFPTYFLFANLIAVPVSSIILFGELFLCTSYWIPFIGDLLGQILSWMIGIMNGWITRVETLPFSSWQGISITTLQAILLYGVIVAVGWYWLIKRFHAAFWFAGSCMIGFSLLRFDSFYNAAKRKGMIIYNIPKHVVVDFFDGRQLITWSDSLLQSDKNAQLFHLGPARTLYRFFAPYQLSYPPTQWFDRQVYVSGQKNNFVEDSCIDFFIVTQGPLREIESFVAGRDVRCIVVANTVKTGLKLKIVALARKKKISLHVLEEKGAFVMQWP